MQPKCATIIFLMVKSKDHGITVRLKTDTPFISVQLLFVGFILKY